MIKKSIHLYFLWVLVLSFAEKTWCENAQQNSSEIIKVTLATPNLTNQAFINANVGFRPYRASGIRIESEFKNNKLIVHNYGYGGSGITLCWGGASETINLMVREIQQKHVLHDCKTIAILGAGVIGLATAYELLHLGYTVHIYARDFLPNVTSSVAAGIWSPPALTDKMPESYKNMLERMLEISKNRFLNSSAALTNSEFKGVGFIDDYSFKCDDGNNILSTTFGSEHSDSYQIVEVEFDNGVKKIGKRKKSIYINGKLFLEDLFDKVKTQGASIKQATFTTDADVLTLPESIIINCTSLGSGELFNDNDFVPVRGHLAYFKKQPEINYMLHQNIPNSKNSWVTVYPWDDRLIIGGILEHGKDECTIDQEVIEMLIANARDCFANQ